MVGVSTAAGDDFGSAGDDLGARLFALVAEAHDAGIDAEAALREHARRYAAQVRRAEEAMVAGTETGAADPV